ncbi:MAG: carbohydrate kinase [Planctomycetaceae bacterium]|jgi:fructokinase|nr:carbohydrate kinase [Planctomycetaceae bacterium]
MYKILSFGEILWDMLPGGKKLGGAPANFAYHCGQFGGGVRLLSRIGNDKLGLEILEQCRSNGVSTELIGIDETLPTGTVAVQLGADGQPAYTIAENAAWDFLQATPAALQWTKQADALCFGTLAFRAEHNRQTLKTLLEAAKPGALRVADINLRQPFCERSVIETVLSSANVLKLNGDELLYLTGGKDVPPEEQLQMLRERYRFRLVILTCGAAGSYLAAEHECVFTPGVCVEVADTVGAGDAFTAVAVLGFLQHKTLRDIGQQANEAAAYVCTQSGGMPPSCGEFLFLR